MIAAKGSLTATQGTDTDELATGYIYVGRELPPVERRGTVILIVDREPLADIELQEKIERLKLDLIGDGWLVQTHTVPRDYDPSQVRAIIRADYNASHQDRDPHNDVEAVFLLGGVPVPYAGNICPDGHCPEKTNRSHHRGAWPADVYYGDVNGVWTDEKTTAGAIH
jgi:hypothetical protein